MVLMLTSSPEKIIMSTQMSAVRMVATEWLLTDALMNSATDVPANDVSRMLRAKNKKHHTLFCRPGDRRGKV